MNMEDKTQGPLHCMVKQLLCFSWNHRFLEMKETLEIDLDLRLWWPGVQLGVLVGFAGGRQGDCGTRIKGFLGSILGFCNLLRWIS